MLGDLTPALVDQLAHFIRGKQTEKMPTPRLPGDDHPTASTGTAEGFAETAVSAACSAEEASTRLCDKLALR